MRKKKINNTKKPKVEKNKKTGKGRPSLYSAKVVDEICARIAEGESIRHISLVDNMPDEATIYRWLVKYPDFCDKYARAKEIQADKFSEELIDIADDGRNDWEERENERTGSIFIALNAEAIGRSRLRVETRKWLMGKHKPKKYGDKMELTGKDGKELEFTQLKIINSIGEVTLK